MNEVSICDGVISRQETEQRTPALVLVQVLRGVAAMFVLLGHVIHMVFLHAASLHTPAPAIRAFPGGFGVDLFFCISGFIMVVSSRRFFAAPRGWKLFISRRAVRLIPLYWLFTLIYLPFLLGGRHGFHGNLPLALTTSLFFIPYSADGLVAPVVYPLYSVGWSLNYEMFFYVVFAGFIFLPRWRAVCGTSLFLGLLVLAGTLLRPHAAVLAFWTAPILLEFGLGLALGLAWLGPARLSPWVCLALAIAAFAVLVVDPFSVELPHANGVTPDDIRGVCGWGLPAAALLTSIGFFEKGRDIRGWWVSAFKRIGDASYSLYLVHPLVLLILLRASQEFAACAVCARLAWPFYVLYFAGPAIAAGLLTHLLVERKLTRWLHAVVPGAGRTATRQWSSGSAAKQVAG